MDNIIYTPSYGNSFALIIGINKYLNASPLEYAVNDAKEVAKILVSDFDFKKNNITVLLNKNATKTKIMDAFMSYANANITSDDRILIYFAGHGTTQTGKRGEVGFLIPHDGDTSNLSTLIRWDDLTRNAELIVAKHIFFVMDACYGGLAITRTPSLGSMRFLKDMLQRYSRQVLTAGKANEVVSDAGGPLPHHSIFTGHFLEGLQGKAATNEDIITANGVMAYVYDKVAKDSYSKQTPHYGFLDGDGDFIFKAPNINKLKEHDKFDEDILISVPTPSPDVKPASLEDLTETTKEYLSDSRYKIKLHDTFNQKLREVSSLLKDDKFKIEGVIYSDQEFLSRIKLYEDIVKELQAMTASVAYWGNNDDYKHLSRTLSRLSDNIAPESGNTILLSLRTYPIFLIMYSAGISAVAANNYEALKTLLTTKVQSPRSTYQMIESAIAIGEASADLNDSFLMLPGHERQYAPRSEYLYKLLQPSLDDLLYLGRDYEEMFDRFEVLLTLVYADLTYDPEINNIWGPFGRFAWKYRRGGRTNNAFRSTVNEANTLKSDWKLLRTGLFSGSIDRFLEISSKFEERIKKLNWI